jgi:hypothetical protein
MRSSPSVQPTLSGANNDPSNLLSKDNLKHTVQCEYFNVLIKIDWLLC